jgi:hypothetical protein
MTPFHEIVQGHQDDGGWTFDWLGWSPGQPWSGAGPRRCGRWAPCTHTSTSSCRTAADLASRVLSAGCEHPHAPVERSRRTTTGRVHLRTASARIARRKQA